MTSGTGATGLGREVLRILGDRVLVEPGLNKFSGTLHRDMRGRTCRALPGRSLMNLLLRSALIGGLLQPALHSAVVEPQPHSDESTPLAGVAVVADGSREWGSSASSDLENLRSQLGPSRPVYVIRFDTDGQYHGPGADGDAIHVPPDTPMKDAIILALEHVSRASRIDSMVVIAHEQISPTYVRTDQLLSRMVRAEVPVHTVHLTRANDKRSPLRRSGEALVSGLAWLVEALIDEDRESYSASDTGRMLQRISGETGGEACVALDEETGARCAEAIAVSINESIVSGLTTEARKSAIEPIAVKEYYEDLFYINEMPHSEGRSFVVGQASAHEIGNVLWDLHTRQRTTHPGEVPTASAPLIMICSTGATLAAAISAGRLRSVNAKPAPSSMVAIQRYSRAPSAIASSQSCRQPIISVAEEGVWHFA